MLDLPVSLETFITFVVSFIVAPFFPWLAELLARVGREADQAVRNEDATPLARMRRMIAAKLDHLPEGHPWRDEFKAVLRGAEPPAASASVSAAAPPVSVLPPVGGGGSVIPPPPP